MGMPSWCASPASFGSSSGWFRAGFAPPKRATETRWTTAVDAELDFASLTAFYYEHVLHEFDEITALSSHGGQDTKAVDEAIDFLLTTDGPWIEP